MKLYALALSPYAARVRLALRVKQVEHVMEPPPGGSTRSAEYLAINPIGKLPVLVDETGLAIAESETIIDYLDDRFPDPPLQPQDAALRARMRNAIRTFELYVTPAMSRLFAQMDPQTRNAEMVAAEIARWRDGIALVEHFVDDATFAVGGAISKADCMVLPGLLLCEVAATIHGLPDPLAQHATLSGYRSKAREHPDMGAVWNDTAEALAAFRSQA